MYPQQLLAKSYDKEKHKKGPPDYALLVQHTRDVANAGDELLDLMRVVVLQAAGLRPEEAEKLDEAVRLNTRIQDFGKANDQFQTMVRGSPEIAQLLRHETISGLIVTRPEFQSWLEDRFAPEVLSLALWGAVGHHRKFSERHWRPKLSERATVFLGHADFKKLLEEMGSDLRMRGLPDVLRDITIGTGQSATGDLDATSSVNAMLDRWELWAEDRDDPEFRKLVALIKAVGIAADICASAVVRDATPGKSDPVRGFVRRNLSEALTPDDFSQVIWHWAKDNIDECQHLTIPERPEALPPGLVVRPFQQEVAASSSKLTLAEAGCGSGKSLAAYLWGRQWCHRWQEGGRLGFRFFFTLPTTGTTTEHFKDYALHAGIPDKLKTLCHSRAEVDLQFFANETAPQEESEAEGFDQAGRVRDPSRQAARMLQAQRDKIESLNLWGTPLAIATADTVLGLMANARKPVYSFPAIMQSAIVFDEVHAYDEVLFGHLMVFLESFPGIPVLLMTASLPEARRRAIEQIRPDLVRVPGPHDLESAERYEPPRLFPSEDEVWRLVRECLTDPERGKVLWIRNQVDWAVDTYRRCFDELPEPRPFLGLYHSRFRYKDRVQVHRSVIDAFQSTAQPALLVATQVAEMSLNLSADLLVTDLASIPALIQRFGRLNRGSSPRSSPSGFALICNPPASKKKPGVRDYLPYTEDDLQQAEEWIRGLSHLSTRFGQKALVEKFSTFAPGRTVDLPTARRNAVFVSGLWQTYPATTRAEGTTISVILEEDHESFPKKRLRDIRFKRSWIREHEVAVPIRPEIREWATFGEVPIAPAKHVHYGRIDDDNPRERVGAQWHGLPHWSIV
jgi:CRISPR-associated endonuclease/helicase Cas3